MQTRLTSDPHSLANIDSVKVNHIEINWNVDFEKASLVGYVELSSQMMKDTKVMILDSNNLKVTAAAIDGRHKHESTSLNSIHHLRQCGGI